jgi:hypothetical protein
VLHQQDVEDLIGKRPYGEKKIFADDEDESPAQSTTVDAPVAEEPINPEPIQEESNPA